MATVNPVVLKEDRKDDGTWNVKIRVTHKNKSRYIKTSIFVSKGQLDKKFKIKDYDVTNVLHPIISTYRQVIGAATRTIEFLDVDQVKAMLVESEQKEPDVDFLDFCRKHIADLKAKGKKTTAGPLETVYRILVDYFGTEKLPSKRINSIFLREFEEYLRNPRKIVRTNQGKDKEYDKPGLDAGGIHNKMRDLRTLFNEARSKFNDEENGIIKIQHYPFKKYEVGKAPKTKKRNLDAETIKLIVGAVVRPGSRQELARDAFAFSYYMLGINAADVYDLDGKKNLKSGRIEYNRKKTKARRKDNAFISVKLIPEAEYFFRKYILTGKLKKSYNGHLNLDRAINVGLKEIGSMPEINVPQLGYYYARYSVGSLARNVCGFSKDDIGEALNHVDDDHKVTDIYIDFDWGVLDRVQAGVVSLLNV